MALITARFTIFGQGLMYIFGTIKTYHNLLNHLYIFIEKFLDNLCYCDFVNNFVLLTIGSRVLTRKFTFLLLIMFFVTCGNRVENLVFLC